MKKIAITGPESTGKSAMAIALADYLKTIYVPEMAREYLEQKGAAYDEADLLKIAVLQCTAEDSAAQSKPPFLICDTDMLVMHIWSKVKYGRIHPFIVDQERRRDYEFTLLMDIDLPWEKDPLREHPYEREVLFQQYHELLKKSGRSFEIISGTGDTRLQNALEALRKHRLLPED